MAKSSTTSSGPTLKWVEETFGMFVSAKEGHHVARFWLMKPGGSPVRCVGESGRRTDDVVGLPVSAATVETGLDGKAKPGGKIGSLPKGRGAGRRIFDFDRIEGVPRDQLARREVRIPLERAIKAGGLVEHTAKEFHDQFLKAHKAERESAQAAQAAKNAPAGDAPTGSADE